MIGTGEFTDAALYLIMMALVVESVFFAQLWLRSSKEMPMEFRLDPAAGTFRDLEAMCSDLQIRLTRQPIRLDGNNTDCGMQSSESV